MEVVSVEDAQGLTTDQPVVHPKTTAANDLLLSTQLPAESFTDGSCHFQTLGFVSRFPAGSVGALGGEFVPDVFLYLSHFVFLQLVEIE